MLMMVRAMSTCVAEGHQSPARQDHDPDIRLPQAVRRVSNRPSLQDLASARLRRTFVDPRLAASGLQRPSRAEHRRIGRVDQRPVRTDSEIHRAGSGPGHAQRAPRTRQQVAALMLFFSYFGYNADIHFFIRRILTNVIVQIDMIRRSY